MTGPWSLFWVTSALQTTMQATAIWMLYQQSRMLHDMNQVVLGANQLSAASVQMSELVKEVRELLSKRPSNNNH